MLKGGYYMMNGSGIVLGGSPQTISGMWKKAVEALSSNKPIFIFNCLENPTRKWLRFPQPVVMLARQP